MLMGTTLKKIRCGMFSLRVFPSVLCIPGDLWVQNVLDLLELGLWMRWATMWVLGLKPTSVGKLPVLLTAKSSFQPTSLPPFKAEKCFTAYKICLSMYWEVRNETFISKYERNHFCRFLENRKCLVSISNWM